MILFVNIIIHVIIFYVKIHVLSKFSNMIYTTFQATMPSSEKHPSTVPMWKGVKVSYTLIAMCLFPLAIGGYWAYGQMVRYISYKLYFMYLFFKNIKKKSLVSLAFQLYHYNLYYI